MHLIFIEPHLEIKSKLVSTLYMKKWFSIRRDYNFCYCCWIQDIIDLTFDINIHLGLSFTP